MTGPFTLPDGRTPMSIQSNINHVSAAVDAPPEAPLLWVLRDLLHLAGSKYRCGIGSCGTFTVLVGGHAVRSCMTAVGDVGSDPVITIEGLSPDGLHPLLPAWKAMDVPQCGYGQAGQIMSSTALLQRTAHPTDSEIDAAMSGNLCRCGPYTRIRQAIHKAVQTGAPTPEKQERVKS